MIRTYNNHFAFTSIGMRLRGIQFYFYDPTHQVANRLSALPRLNVSIVEHLVEVMQSNHYTIFLRQVSTLDNIEEYNIVIRSNPSLDQREYSRPMSTEVAGIWIEDETAETSPSETWDIRVYTKSGSSHKVQYYYACYDPLQYVLMFPNGEPRWHGNIPKVGCTVRKKLKHGDLSQYNSFEEILETEKQGASKSKQREGILDYITSSGHNPRQKRASVSCREYYVYKLQQREMINHIFCASGDCCSNM
ncbi:hypothetical protein LIER_20994 [Lithospermum erythrorhizon]|uniref:Uncharacterized protein n=1 Tax=Lithospermum erythrorhizon TaxID=34254 RepID=A0AAV3QSP2_LITER